MSIPQEFHISFHFNGAKRSRSMQLLPRVGDIIQLNDAHQAASPPDWISLHVDSVYIHEGGRSWEYWANCTLKA